jgi:uncharacterized protein (DUF885 family)
MKSAVPYLLRLTICFAALGAQAPVQTQSQTKTEPPAQTKVEPPKKDATAEPAKPQEPLVPNLQEIIAKPISPVRMISQRFDADRGNLNRTYTVAQSPARFARMAKFYAEWSKALADLDTKKLTDAGRNEVQQLQENVKRHQRELEQQKKAQAEVVFLLPFGGAIVELEDSRRRMERLDSAKAAGVLTEMVKGIAKSHKALEASLAKGSTTKPPAKELRTRAADAVRDLRTALRNWNGFYDGYDPVYMFWMGEPYKASDKALQDYITLLRTKEEPEKAEKAETKTAGPDATTRPTTPPTAAPAKSAVSVAKDEAPISKAPPVAEKLPTENDVPDLATLLAFPQSEFQGVIQRYQTGRSNIAGRLATMPAPPADAPARTPDRQARAKKFYGEWQAALRKLSFDALSKDAQVDYLLLQNQIQHELKRADNPAPTRGGRGGAGAGRQRDELAIEGRPIGRQAMLDELALEMIPYSPEELIVIAEKEFAWCDAEMLKASHELGFGDDWKRAIEKAKTMHVEPGHQPEAIRDLAWEATDYVRKYDLVSVPQLVSETWRMQMMSPQRQLVSPFFLGGEVILVSFPTNTMAYDAKLQSMRGNNIPFSRATVHHELIPGHGLQQFMTPRYRSYRNMFSTPFWTEGWSLYWEFILYQRGFPKTAEDRVGFLFWRMHRCARIIFSLNYHLGKWPAQKCVDFLVDRVGHERDNATAEVRRSFTGGYGPLYQAAYMLGGLQIRELHKELVDSGKMTDRDFHDAVLQQNRIPITMVRASLTKQALSPDKPPEWRFYGPINAPKAVSP